MRSAQTLKAFIAGALSFAACVTIIAIDRESKGTAWASAELANSIARSAASGATVPRGQPIVVVFNAPTANPSPASSGTNSPRPAPSGDECGPSHEVQSAVVGDIRGADRNGDGFLDSSEISESNFSLSGRYCPNGDSDRCLRWPVNASIQTARIPLEGQEQASLSIGGSWMGQPGIELETATLLQCTNTQGKLRCKWDLKTRDTRPPRIRAQSCDGLPVAYSELVAGGAVPTPTGSATNVPPTKTSFSPHPAKKIK